MSLDDLPSRDVIEFSSVGPDYFGLNLTVTAVPEPAGDCVRRTPAAIMVRLGPAPSSSAS
jgi:hypothetical protein